MPMPLITSDVVKFFVKAFCQTPPLSPKENSFIHPPNTISNAIVSQW